MDLKKRIEVIIDVIGDKAGSLKKFRTDFSAAEGASGKFKIAAGGAMDYAREHAGQLALIGGAALVKFAADAATALVDTAKAAVDTGKQMGDSTEDASRWIAVGDDFTVTADKIVAGGKEITKHLGEDKWDKYGIATETADGKMRATGETLKDILVTISAQKTPQDQQRVGIELLGKAYGGLAPLVGHTREEYDDMLSSVEAGQVITDKEAAKAEKLRLAQDALADALKEVQLAVGQVVAEMSPLLEWGAKAIGWAIELKSKLDDTSTALGKVGTAAQFITNPLGKLGDVADIVMGRADGVAGALEGVYDTATDKFVPATEESTDVVRGLSSQLGATAEDFKQYDGAVDAARDATREGKISADEYSDAVSHAGEAARDGHEPATAWGKAIDGVGNAAATSAGEIRDLRDATREAEGAARDADTAYSNLMGKLNAVESWDAAQKAVDQYIWKMNDGVTSTDEQEQALRDAIRAVADFVKETDTIPASKKTDIYAQLDAGNLAAANAIIDEIAKARQLDIKVKLVSPNGSSLSNATLSQLGVMIPGFAKGTNSAPGGLALVGEQGPELVNLPQGSSVTPAPQTAAMLGGPQTIEVHVHSADERMVIGALKRYAQNGGKNPWPTR